MPVSPGGVGERSNPTDCNSVAKASKVRILPPPPYFPTKYPCGCGLVVEPQPSKLMVRVRFPPPAPFISKTICSCSSGVEHFLGKEEVASSILAKSSIFNPLKCLFQRVFWCNSIYIPSFHPFCGICLRTICFLSLLHDLWLIHLLFGVDLPAVKTCLMTFMN